MATAWEFLRAFRTRLTERWSADASLSEDYGKTVEPGQRTPWSTRLLGPDGQPVHGDYGLVGELAGTLGYSTQPPQVEVAAGYCTVAQTWSEYPWGPTGPWRMRVVVEHEGTRGGGYLDPLIKLLAFRVPLRVVIGYPSETHGEETPLAHAQEFVEPWLQAAGRWGGLDDELLLILGHWESWSKRVWRGFFLHGPTPFQPITEWELP